MIFRRAIPSPHARASRILNLFGSFNSTQPIPRITDSCKILSILETEYIYMRWIRSLYDNIINKELDIFTIRFARRQTVSDSREPLPLSTTGHKFRKNVYVYVSACPTSRIFPSSSGIFLENTQFVRAQSPQVTEHENNSRIILSNPPHIRQSLPYSFTSNPHGLTC